MVHVFLDCDGVLADFDKRAEEIFGMRGQDFEDQYGSKEFWRQIRNDDEFFLNLELMSDALELYDAVRHLDHTILTGAPMGNWAKPQKLEWRNRKLPETEMIVVCPSKDKWKHMINPGDILVDDLLKHSQVWIDNGGRFVHHTSAKNSIKMLKELGVL